MIQNGWWPEIGGGHVHVKNLSTALAEEFGHTVDIYTRGLQKDGVEYLDTEIYAGGAVRVHRMKPATEIQNTIGRLSSLITPIPHLLTEEFDVIHGHTFLPAVPTRIAGKVSNTPTVYTVHGTALTTGVGLDESVLAPVKRRLERQIVLKFDYNHVISVNNEHTDLLEKYHGNVSYIPNGVNLDRFDVNVSRKGEILFLGRLAPKKRVNDLIDAFNQIADEFPQIDLVIVGTGKKRANLEKQAKKQGVDDRVHFEGRVSDEAIPYYYRRAQLFVLPSIWEGHPLTLLEAWASEVPIIASNTEGIDEFVEHMETGYLVPPKSPAKLAEALRYALTNPNKNEQWATNAYQVVRQNYSWSHVASKTEDIYKKIVEET